VSAPGAGDWAPPRMSCFQSTDLTPEGFTIPFTGRHLRRLLLGKRAC
jgi:hypothetical protein